MAHVITRMIAGGASQVLTDLINGLAENENVQQFLYTGPNDLPENFRTNLHIDRQNIIVVPSLVRNISPIKDLKARNYFKSEFKTQQFDIVHSHTSKAGIVARLPASDCSKVVHTAHGHIYQEGARIDAVPQKSVFRNILLRAEQFAGKFTNALICLSEDEKTVSVEKSLAASHNIYVIPNGINLDKYRFNEESRSRVRNKLQLDDAFTIICVGRVDPEKGQSVLLEAARKILEEGLNIRFMIVGDGKDLEAFKQEYVAEMNAGEILFLGYISDVQPYLSAADAACIPSFYEGFGLAAIEAMACGLPIICSETGGLKELLSENREGYFFKNGNSDALAAVLKKLYNLSAEKYQLLKQQAYKKAQEHDTQSMVEAYLNVYKKILNA